MKESNVGASTNLKNMQDREVKMLNNYEKYQRIWRNNLQPIEVARSRINEEGMSKNHKANKQLTEKGDTLIQDRLDDFLDHER